MIIDQRMSSMKIPLKTDPCPQYFEEARSFATCCCKVMSVSAPALLAPKSLIPKSHDGDR